MTPPDDTAVGVFALWLRRGWNNPHLLLRRIQRYAQITLLPVVHEGTSEAHFGPCTDTVFVDGSDCLGIR